MVSGHTDKAISRDRIRVYAKRTCGYHGLRQVIPDKERAMRKSIISLAILLLVTALPAAAAQGPDIPVGDSPSFGPANAPVTIIEFIDFQ